MKLIAGIDPGTTTGIAVADISSDFCEAFSSRNMSAGDICSFLSERGKPVIIASDVNRAPRSLRKIASSFNAQLICPEYDLTSEEKKRLVAGRACNNMHERDALGAAIFARKKFSPLFRKVDFALKKKNLFALADEVKELLVKRKAGNIERAVGMLTAKKEVKEKSGYVKRKQGTEPAVFKPDKEQKKLQKRITELDEENKDLRIELRILKNRDENEVVKNLRRNIAMLSEEKKRIEEEYETYRNISGRYEIIVPSDSFENISGRVVLLINKSDAVRIEAGSPKAIISDSYIDTDIPVIPLEKIKLGRAGNFIVSDRNELDKLISSSFPDWLKRYKEARRNI